MMRRLTGIPGLFFLAVILLLAEGAVTITGRLTASPDGAPAIETKDGRLIRLDGDRETLSVLADTRLKGRELGLRGRYAGKDRFRLAPFHTKAFWVIENGRKLYVSYWCATCAIRTYTPGICMCCQRETELELREEDGH